MTPTCQSNGRPPVFDLRTPPPPTLGIRPMSFLSRILGNRERRELHSTFGSILLFKGKRASYWEAEPLLRDEPISVGIETTGEEPPSEAQVQFYQRLTSDADVAFR